MTCANRSVSRRRITTIQIQPVGTTSGAINPRLTTGGNGAAE